MSGQFLGDWCDFSALFSLGLAIALNHVVIWPGEKIMLNTLTLKALVLGALLASEFAPFRAFANTPMEQVQETVGQVVNVVGRSADTDEQRKASLRETLMPRFDWYEMARQTLGKNWNIAAGRENEFVAAFAEFLGNAYVGTIGSYKGEKILFLQERIDHDQAQVKTKILPSKGDSTSVDYRLHRVQDEWKIYDVLIEDISLVVNYRSQFNRILAKGSIDDLLAQLREKNLTGRK
jgi:phospholipid transport system substrate-binding protein